MYVLADQFGDVSPTAFDVRKRRALIDLDVQIATVRRIFARRDTCAGDEARHAAGETLAAGVFAVFTGPSQDEVRQRINSCRQQFFQARGDAMTLNVNLLLMRGRVQASRNNDELEAAYVTIPPEQLREVLLHRLDNVSAVYAEHAGSLSFGASLLPNVAQPLQIHKVATQQYRDRIASAPTSVEMMRLWAEYESTSMATMRVFMARAAGVASADPAVTAAQVAGPVLEGVAERVGETLGAIGGAAGRGILTIFWEVFKVILPAALVVGVGWYGWKNRHKLFGKPRLQERTDV